MVAAFEGGLVGLHWGNLNVMPGETNFSFQLAVGMLLVDAVLYGIMAAYLEAVLPSDYGTQLPWYFPFLPSFWRGLFFGPASASSSSRKESDLTEALLAEEGGLGGGARVEEVDGELKRQEDEGRSLSIRSLRRVFKTTAEDRVAVDNLSLDMYEGQITVLLGHNG